MLLAHGMSDKTIARQLGISDFTARTHRTQMLRRAAVTNVCGLLFTAISSGWVAIDGTPAARTAFAEWSDSTDE